ncbi:MAG: hypothetical protein ACK5MT_09480 [Actinomycetales bacterium]
MAGPQEQAETWIALADFVAWLVHRYDLVEDVPHSWWRHPPVVEHPTALMVA